MGGRASVRRLGITGRLIVEVIAEGTGQAVVLREYPHLEAEGIRQALRYAACLTREDVLPA